MVSTVSVEIKSKIHVKNVVISNETHEKVLFVAELGDILELFFIDDEVLEYKGTNGTLRVDLEKPTLCKLLGLSDASTPSSLLGSSKNTKIKEEKNEN